MYFSLQKTAKTIESEIIKKYYIYADWPSVWNEGFIAVVCLVTIGLKVQERN